MNKLRHIATTVRTEKQIYKKSQNTNKYEDKTGLYKHTIKASVIKTVWCWHMSGQTSEKNRTYTRNVQHMIHRPFKSLRQTETLPCSLWGQVNSQKKVYSCFIWYTRRKSKWIRNLKQELKSYKDYWRITGKILFNLRAEIELLITAQNPELETVQCDYITIFLTGKRNHHK